ncbi:menaquinone-specific isochorismate synthase [Salmonella bongori]|nr:menaquinone-specific isochorismate synthase [Salmonella bongori]
MVTKRLPFSGRPRYFHHLIWRNSFLRQHQQPDLRIWGLNAFEPKEGYLLFATAGVAAKWGDGGLTITSL